MILRVEFDDAQTSLAEIRAALEPVEKSKQQVIRIQSEDLFTAMNEV